MATLKIYTKKEILSFVKKRKGETKFGEKVHAITHANDFVEELKLTTAKYVLFGIPESVGIKANNGVQGAETTFHNTLKSLLNTQNNEFNKAKKVLLLGHLDCAKEMETLVQILLTLCIGNPCLRFLVLAGSKMI